jgi:bifunctional non-homologous end joining protein LigD
MARAASPPSNRPLVAGVGISHPERTLFPAVPATKLDLARYYDAVAPWMLPDLIDRPLTLVHCPKGIPPGGAQKGLDCVFMKHAKVWGPSAIRRVRIREKTKTGEYLIADSVEALVSLAQMDILEIHTWNSRFARLEQPDRVVIDLDPGDQVAWPAVVAAAKTVRGLLRVLDLESFVNKTGGRGLHVVVPLTPSAELTDSLAFARALALALVRRSPRQFTERFSKSGRGRKILIDYLRNNRTNTSIAAYSTRAKPDAPVSTPITWNELSDALSPERFTLTTIVRRLRKREDPWNAYWTTRQRLSLTAIRALDAM